MRSQLIVRSTRSRPPFGLTTLRGATFPAAVLLELAADAYLACRSSRLDRLEIEGLAERMLPESPARGNVGHSKRRHCVQGAVLIAAGAEPEDAAWWSLDDLWRHALDAVVDARPRLQPSVDSSPSPKCASLTRRLTSPVLDWRRAHIRGNMRRVSAESECASGGNQSSR